MKIPDKVKIGGMVYEVKIVNEDAPAACNWAGDIDYHNAVIRLVEANERFMQVTLLHEILHGIYEGLGYTQDNNEKQVEELAYTLYALIVDNPSMFATGNNKKGGG